MSANSIAGHATAALETLRRMFELRELGERYSNSIDDMQTLGRHLQSIVDAAGSAAVATAQIDEESRA